MWAFLDPHFPDCTDTCSDYKDGLDLVGITKVTGYHKITCREVTYEGEWHNGMKHGYGKEIDVEGNILRKGNWIEDQFQGATNT